MSDIAELERRLTAALDRIGAGLESLDGAPAAPEEPAADPAEVTQLREELEAERTAVAQLEERVRALRTQMDEREAEVRAEIEAAQVAARDGNAQLTQARRTVQMLQEALDKLRAAAETGVVEPHMINQAMQSELEGLRVMRATDRAELDAVLDALEPHVKEAEDA